MGKLNDLIVDEEKIGEELLYEILSNYMKLGKNSKELIFSPEFNQLKIDDRIIVYLLGKKALKMVNFLEDEKTKPKTTPIKVLIATITCSTHIIAIFPLF